MVRDSERPTSPPGPLELELVEFERQISRMGENDARLARLAELLAWGEHGEE